MERILGIDFGRKRVGLAISDPLWLTAQPLGVVVLSEALPEIIKLVEKFQVKRIVVGLPVNMNGTSGPAAEEVRQFAAEVKTATSQEVIFVDERLTTSEAQRSLIEAGVKRSRRKQVVDQSAAALILAIYLERQKNVP
jgi:putative Holliday junction resolvase